MSLALLTLGSQWVARWADTRDPMVWTVRGLTDHGVYFTSPESRSPGHLLSPNDFLSQYIPLAELPRKAV